MMNRSIPVLKTVNAVFKSQSRNGSHGHMSMKQINDLYKATMNHLPKPEGSWEAGYKAKDVKANVFLLASTAVFGLTLMEMQRQGCFDLLTDPACWSDKQVERQAKYYAKGDKWRAIAAGNDE